MNLSWLAHTVDGVKIPESECNYKDLPRQDLVSFDLWGDTKLLIRIDLRPDILGKKSLIFRRRVRRENNGTELVWYIAGYKRETGQSHLVYLFEDGAILLGGEPENGKDFQEPVTPFPWESDLQWQP